ncbi:MAG: TetR/AcrR family transcriptional regulator, partial [Frankiales bacterium]|nr:TetR/AcrR family transcriptional regulator [Frankiales bacterium]
ELAPTPVARFDLSRALVSVLTGLNSQALPLRDPADFAGPVRPTRALLAMTATSVIPSRGVLPVHRRPCLMPSAKPCA